ncbi:MAG: periplasmic heavy metal sensor [Pseudomonadota bacterium]
MAEGRRSGMAVWLKVLLAVSLSLNLLIAGAVIGIAVTGGPFRPPGDGDPPRVVEGNLGPLTFALTRDQRSDFRRELRANAREFAQLRRENRAAITDLVDQLRRDPLDAEAMVVTLDKLAAASSKRRAVGQQALIRQIEGMSASERSALADRIDQMLERIGKHRARRD